MILPSIYVGRNRNRKESEFFYRFRFQTLDTDHTPNPRSGLAMWEEIQILVCQAALLTCCFGLSSQGGSFANTHSRLAASFAQNTFMFECAFFSLPLGSYKLAINLRAPTIEVFSSSPPRKTSSAKESTPFSEIVLYTEFFPILKKTWC